MLVGSLLLVSELGKAIDPTATERVVQAWMASALGWESGAPTGVRVLVFFELLLGVWLLRGLAARGAMLAVSALMLLFIARLLSAREGVAGSGCGCGLPAWLGDDLGAVLARNGVLLVGSLALFLTRPLRVLRPGGNTKGE